MEYTFGIDEINDIAERFKLLLQQYHIFAFDGNLGAGKTTFIKELCKTMGVNENVSSPTFSIINQYELPDKKSLIHIDLYRIKEEQEAINAGVEEYLQGTEICLVEWAVRVPQIFPYNTVHVYLQMVEGDKRHMKIELPNKTI